MSQLIWYITCWLSHQIHLLVEISPWGILSEEYFPNLTPFLLIDAPNKMKTSLSRKQHASQYHMHWQPFLGPSPSRATLTCWITTQKNLGSFDQLNCDHHLNTPTMRLVLSNTTWSPMRWTHWWPGIWKIYQATILMLLSLNELCLAIMQPPKPSEWSKTP